MTDRVVRRASALKALNFTTVDALHIACAEAGQSDLLLTTDDRFLCKARKHRNILKVRVENPILWLMEVTQDEADKPGTH